LQKSAPLLCAGVTVYSPMKKYLKPGMKTAVIGIGGLGHIAIQFLSKLGHEVTAVTTSDDKNDLIKTLGATNILNVNKAEDLEANQFSFDFIINTAPSNKDFDQLFKLTAPAGYFVQVGLPDADTNLLVPCQPLVGNEITLVGSLVGSRADTVEMLKLCAEKNIYPINEEFAFEDFDKALDKLENGRPKFRCTVNVQDFSKKHNHFKK